MKRALTYLLGSWTLLVASLVQAQTAPTCLVVEDYEDGIHNPTGCVAPTPSCTTDGPAGCVVTSCETVDVLEWGGNNLLRGTNTYSYALNDFSCSCMVDKIANWVPDPVNFDGGHIDVTSIVEVDKLDKCAACAQNITYNKKSCSGGTSVQAAASAVHAPSWAHQIGSDGTVPGCVTTWTEDFSDFQATGTNVGKAKITWGFSINDFGCSCSALTAAYVDQGQDGIPYWSPIRLSAEEMPTCDICGKAFADAQNTCMGMGNRVVYESASVSPSPTCSTVTDLGCAATSCQTVGAYAPPIDGGNRATGVDIYTYTVNDFSCTCNVKTWATFSFVPCVPTLAGVCPDVVLVYDSSITYPPSMYSITSPTGQDLTGCDACVKAVTDSKNACESGTPTKVPVGPSKDGSSVSGNSTPSTVDVGGGCSFVQSRNVDGGALGLALALWGLLMVRKYRVRG